eukprot:jgi/Mesvir1/14249/Mv09685-RA.1
MEAKVATRADAEAAAWGLLHAEACAAGRKMYIDPASGLQVMTEVAHQSRGYCCGSGCRHCPFAHARVPVDKRAALSKVATWLHVPDDSRVASAGDKESGSRSRNSSSSSTSPGASNHRGDAQEAAASRDGTGASSEGAAVVLFWSSGKDSYLALRALERQLGGQGVAPSECRGEGEGARGGDRHPPRAPMEADMVRTRTKQDVGGKPTRTKQDAGGMQAASGPAAGNQPTRIGQDVDVTSQGEGNRRAASQGEGMGRAGMGGLGTAGLGTPRGGERLGIVLLTTFDAGSRTIAHQGTSVADAVKQARALGRPLLGVPLHPGGPAYVDAVDAGLELVRSVYPAGIRALAFGDLHLHSIRSWREAALSPLGAPLQFPLWRVPYDQLLHDLATSGVVCVVSAVTDAAKGVVQVGDVFGADLVARAGAAGIDAFGEAGEFHTLARVWERS